MAQFLPSPPPRTGPQGVIPSSVVVGSGSASVAADGTVTFTGVSSISLNDVFDGLSGDTYELSFSGNTLGANGVYMRLRKNNSDSATGYSRAYINRGGWGSDLGGGYGSPSNELLYLAPAAQVSRIFSTVKFFQPGSVQPAALGISVSRNGSTQNIWIEQSISTLPDATGFSIMTVGGLTMSGVLKVVRIA